MKLINGHKIVMVGDSITDAGRRDSHPPYGRGYVAQVRSDFTERHPGLDLVWKNRGVSGDTTRHLAARWNEDVIAENPDVLTIMIGINDVWRRFGDHPLEAVPADEYVSTLVTLLRQAKEQTGAGVIVASPYMVDADNSNPMRVAMDMYGGLAREIAAEVGATFIDIQAAFDRVLTHSASENWTDDRNDRIHLNADGHRIISSEFLRVFEAEARHER
jgi:lysophospholipase L1-like esterase